MTVRRSRSDLFRSKKFRHRQRTEARSKTVRNLRVETLEERRLLATGPQLVGIQPNSDEFINDGDIRHVAPTTLTFRFDGDQAIDAATLDGIQITRSGHDGLFGDDQDVVIQPGYMGIGDDPSDVILRFAESLPDDNYRIDIIGFGDAPLKNVDGDAFNDGIDQQIDFRLDLGAQVAAVVPQPIDRDPVTERLVQHRDQIRVYFNNDPLDPAGAQNPDLYQLIITQETVDNTDDGAAITPTGAVYDQSTNMVTLTFANDLANLAGVGTLRLRIGTDETAPLAPNPLDVGPASPNGDAGSSFGTAFPLGQLGTQSQLLASQIDTVAFDIDFPGGNDEPGHREIPEEIAGGFENHINPAFGADNAYGITTISYNFKPEYRVDDDSPLMVNLITDVQEDLARQAFEMWSHYLGVQFLETPDQGLTIVTGDPRALDPADPNVVNHALDKPTNDLNFIARVDPAYQDSLLILDNAQQWNDGFGGDWFETTLTGIGFMLGLERASDLPPSTLMAFGSDYSYPGATTPEPIFIGNHDILHGRYLHRPDGNDIDMYRFTVVENGEFSAETFAERQLPDASLLDTYLTLYRENPDGSREVIARNDDYYSNDSFMRLQLEPGTYFLGVTASGNTSYNPEFENTGLGGQSQGDYDLRVNFQPDATGSNVLQDADGTSFDGDANGQPGGTYNFWFRSATAANTLIVDTNDAAATDPLVTHTNIADALASVAPNQVIRIVGNGGLDHDLSTLDDNFAYEIGVSTLANEVLSDGLTFDVPKDVTVMIDAGAILKLRQARIGVGSSSLGVDRSGGALQVLGTPEQSVHFTSYLDEAIGLDTLTATTTPSPGDWGGLVYRNDLDNATGRVNAENNGIFLNYVNHADIRYGGGNVDVDSVRQTITPIQLTESRPTISFNSITQSADAPISADPNSFEETNFHAPVYQHDGSGNPADFTLDYQRVGPDIHANLLTDNSNNGIFVRIKTPAGNKQNTLTVPGRFDDTDIVHILSENLQIEGNPGGPFVDPATGDLVARPDARLAIDPGIVVKTEGSRIELSFGAQLIAEGQDGQEVIFTSRADDRYGAGGTFDTNGDLNVTTPAPGDWGGIFVGHLGEASIDHALLTFGGGTTKIEGTFKAFNILELHQGDLRLANSIVERNAEGLGGQGPVDRFGRGYNESATIYVRGAQPLLLNNTIRDNDARALTINANSFTSELIDDDGRSTGPVQTVGAYPENQGPLIRGNMLVNNPLNGMDIRGQVLTTQSVWDDTDIVHVLRGEQIIVPEFHSNVGLRLESNPGSSLVVKLDGPGDNFDPYIGAGFTATGRPLGIADRIGGTMQIVGQPDFPVVLTSLRDDTVGAGLTPTSTTQTDTNNDGGATLPGPGDWRSVRLEEFANDRNVELVVEAEARDGKAPGENATTSSAQYLGELAPAELAGDDNLRLGFDIHAVLNEPNDADVYSFDATAGTEVWLDIDRTTPTLNSVVELLDAQGTVIARSNDSWFETLGTETLFVNSLAIAASDVNPLQKANDAYQAHHVISGEPKDFNSMNIYDAGMRVVLPGVEGTRSTYHVRVRSNTAPGDIDNLAGGLTSGSYQLQVRLREADEVAGVTVRYADIRYATNGVEAFGLPGHSPLVGEVAEDEAVGGPETNNVIRWSGAPGAGPQDLGNLLRMDRATISVAGELMDSNDVDIYEFQVGYEAVGADETGHVSVIFDIDYADGLARPDTNLVIFDSTGRPILMGADSSIADDRPGPLTTNGDMADLSRGSVGSKDPYIGPVALPQGTYFVAVMSDDWTVNQLLNNLEVRIEPINSVARPAEDHIYHGYDVTPDPDTSNPDTAPINPYLFSDANIYQSSNQTTLPLLDPRNPAYTWRIALPGANPEQPARLPNDPPPLHNFPFPGAVYPVERNAIAGQGQTPVEMYDDSGTNNPWVIETEPNDSIATSQDLERELWTTGYNADIEDSTDLAHVSIIGATGDGTRDYYAFEVAEAGTRGVFDIDIDWDEILDPTGYMDANLRLWSETGALLTRTDDLGLLDDGSFDRPTSPGYNTDPMIDYTFQNPGRYIIEVTRTLNGILYQPPQPGDLYTLHTSVDGHPTGGITPADDNFALMIGAAGSFKGDIIGATNTDPIVVGYSPLPGDPVPTDNPPGSGSGTTRRGQGVVLTTDPSMLTTDPNYPLRDPSYPGRTIPNVRVATGASVSISNVRGNTNANGTYAVTHVGDTRFSLNGRKGNGNYDPPDPSTNPPEPDDFWRYTGGYIPAQNDSGGFGSVYSNEFNLAGYSTDDAPQLYFNYFLDLAADEGIHLLDIYVVDSAGNQIDFDGDGDTNYDRDDAIVGKGNGLQNIAEWRTTRVDLSAALGMDDARLEFHFDAATDETWLGYAGFAIDDMIIGFAERGEVILRADSDSAIVPDPLAPGDGTLFGEYQLEIRRAEQFGTSQHPTVDDNHIADRSFLQNRAFDTNDRLTQQLTLVAPSGADLQNAAADSQTFTISDGVNAVVFELDLNSNGVAGTNRPVPYTATSTEAEVATAIRDAINDPAVQDQLEIQAGLSDGTNVGPNVNNAIRVNLYGNAIASGDAIAPAKIDVVAFDDIGDTNLFRDQGQLLIHSNFITDSRDFGIVTDAGPRDFEPTVNVAFLGPHPGAARNLRELNNDPDGGLAPGSMIENNVIAGEGLGGIHVSGNIAPFEIVPRTDLPGALSGELICDGQTFTVHSDRTTVTFEFEDISGGSAPCGSAKRGGNGWQEGHQPVFYRQSGNNWLYPPRGIPPYPYPQFQVAVAIRDAIQSSILVTNGTTLHTNARLAESRWQRNALTAMPLLSVYLDNVTAVDTHTIGWLDSREVPLGAAAQPFTRVVNNTVFGNDGLRSFYPGSGQDEPNDTMDSSVETRQGRQHNPQSFVDTATIGDGIDTPSDASLDVDMYQLHLEAGERVTIDIDALVPRTLDSIARLFDASGNEVAFSDNDQAPGEGPSASSYIDFTATTGGTYYVGVSGKTNETYDPHSLGNRIGPASVGDYRIEVNVIAPRTWVIDARHGQNIPDGATFTVSDINNSVTYEFDDVNAPGVTPGNIAIPYDSTRLPSPTGNTRGPGYTVADVAVSIANTVGQGLTDVSAVALGGVAGATPALPVAPRIDGDTVQYGANYPFAGSFGSAGIQGFGHDSPLTPTRAAGERYVVISGASNVTGSAQIQPMLTDNIDQLLPETGILVSENASPTLLNNVLANLNAGIWQDASPSTVVGASIYQHNDVADSNVGAAGDDFNIALGNYEPLFVNAEAGNFYPATQSLAIDSALDSMEDRSGFIAVKDAVGLPVSPILAPTLDASGLLRSDDPDVDTPSGIGANVFKDRGGLDRADFAGPDAVLIDPRDNDASGIDEDPAVTIVKLADGLYDQFAIQLVDGLEGSESGEGIGIDDLTVDATKVTLTADGTVLEEGIDYTFRYDPTTNTIRLIPLGGFWNDNSTYVITMPNSDRFVIEMPNGGDVSDGDTFFITDETNGTVTFEFESGYSLHVPETLTLQVPVEGIGAGGIQDGQRFVVANGLGQFFTFEYDLNEPANHLPLSIRIDISLLTTDPASVADPVDYIAQQTADALNTSGIGVTSRYLGDGAIHFGARASFAVDTSLTALTQTGEPGVVADGQTILVTQGLAPPVVFEFDSDSSIAGDFAIIFDDTFTRDEISDAIVTAVTNSGIGLTPTNFGEGHVHLGGTVDDVVNVTSAPKLTLSGKPGVQPSTRITVPALAAKPGGIQDGQTFLIDDSAGNAVTFEFDSNGSVQPGNRALLFTAASTVDELAATIIAGIKLAPVGLDPIYLGRGEIDLVDTIHHLTDVSQSALTKIGVPGGVIPIPFTPDASFTTEDFAQVILDAIHDPDTPLIDVEAMYRGGNTYFLDGIRTVSGLTNFFIGAIKDQAGNSLKPNQANNQTQFTILMPAVELDYGDAPAPYFNSLDQNGARHVVSDTTPLFLGNQVTTEDGTAPDADPADGVVFTDASLNIGLFNADLDTPITVTASDRGLLDVWVDFNGNGNWNDPGEQLLANQQLEAGANSLVLVTPSFINVPLAVSTYARFRFSTEGELNPNGLAIDGEVEDYPVMIVPGVPPVAVDDPHTDANSPALYATDANVSKELPLNTATPATDGYGVLDNDFDADGDTINVYRVDGTSALGATISYTLGDATIDYDPTLSVALAELGAGHVVQDTFAYQIVDSNGLVSNTATITVTVTGVNDAPVPGPDAYITPENQQLIIDAASGVLANDTDPDVNDPDPTYRDSLTSDPGAFPSTQGAQVVLGSDGSFTYDPTGVPALQAATPNSPVIDTFSYTVRDEAGVPATGTVTITVTGVNHAPIVVDDSFTTDEDSPLPPDDAARNLLDNDTEPDGDTLNVIPEMLTSTLGAAVVLNSDGTFSYDPTGSAQLQAIATGDPPMNDTFDYTAIDGSGDTTTGTVTITVTGLNDAPVGNDDSYATQQDRILQIDPDGVLTNDTDADTGDQLTVSTADSTSALGAAVTVNADGSFRYDITQSSNATLFSNPIGSIVTDTFSYTVSDGHATSTATVSIAITRVNMPPVAGNDSYGPTSEDVVLDVAAVNGVFVNDDDYDPGQTIRISGFDSTSVLGATVTMNATTGAFTYDPTSAQAAQELAAGVPVSDTFTYTIIDNDPTAPKAATATVTVVLIGQNDAPVAMDDQDATRTGQSVVVDILDNDFDIDGALVPSTIAVVQPTNGLVNVNPTNGLATYTPAAGFVGTDTFTYTVEDNNGQASNVATVTINVISPPVAVNDEVTTFKNVPITIDVLANDTDEGTLVPTSVTVVNQPDHGAVNVLTDGSIVYTPDFGFSNADDTFTYTVDDNDGLTSNEATVLVHVLTDPFPWQNPIQSLDVNADGFISPLDALLVINHLNAHPGESVLPNPPIPPLVPPPYLDTTGDNLVTPLDALLVINYLNAAVGQLSAAGEAEGEADSLLAATSISSDLGSSVFYAGPTPASELASGSQDSLAVSPVTGNSDRIADTNDGIRTGQEASSNVENREDPFGHSPIEDALNDIAEDIGQTRGDDLLNDLAIDQLLGGSRRSDG